MESHISSEQMEMSIPMRLGPNNQCTSELGIGLAENLICTPTGETTAKNIMQNGTENSVQLRGEKSEQPSKLQSQVSPEKILDHPSLPKVLQIKEADFRSFVEMLSEYRRTLLRRE